MFTRYENGQPVKLAQPLLFNLRNDVGEQRDLAAQQPERYQQLIKSAHDYLLSLGEKRPPLFDI